MPCEWMWNTSNDLRTSLLVITKGNGFYELKGFLKHDYFVYEPIQFTFPIGKQHLEVKTIKGKRNQNE